MMNNDEKIFELLYELKYIHANQGMFDSLDKLYSVAEHLIDNNEYSDINVRDSEGNTFLHLTAKASNIEWSEKLLRKGANPFLLNNKNHNIFVSSPSYDYHINLMKCFRNIFLDENFKKKTQGFSSEFRQSLFDNKARSPLVHHSIQEIEQYLQDVEMYTDENVFKMLGRSILIKFEDKIKFVISKDYTAQQNSQFFKYVTDINYRHFIFKDKKLENQFFSLPFECNDDFKDALVMLVLDDTTSQEVFYNIISLMFEQNLNFQHQTKSDETIEQFLQKRDNTKQVYTNLKLKYTLLKEEKNPKRAVKI